MRTQKSSLVIQLLFATGILAIVGPKANNTRAADLTAAVRYKEDMLEKMQPALESAGGASRLYYSSPCKYPERLVDFPKLRLRSGPSKSVGVAAVQGLFADNKNVKVSNSMGIVRITVGKPSRDLLNTRISLLRLNSHEQYNPIAAIFAIEDNESVKEATRNLGLKELPGTFSYNTVYPSPSAPHLPTTLRDVTLDEALDAVARTFKALVIYGECEGHGHSRHFTIDFAWIAQLYSEEDSWKQTGSCLNILHLQSSTVVTPILEESADGVTSKYFDILSVGASLCEWRDRCGWSLKARSIT